MSANDRVEKTEEEEVDGKGQIADRKEEEEEKAVGYY
jgi:hypothetical protein